MRPDIVPSSISVIPTLLSPSPHGVFSLWWSWTSAAGIVRLTVVLCSIGWVFHGVLFDGLEMEERKLSVSMNGRRSGYIYSLGEVPSQLLMYGQMDFLPFGPTYFSAFLFGEVNTQFEELLQFYVHFLWFIKKKKKCPLFMNSEHMDTQSKKKNKEEKYWTTQQVNGQHQLRSSGYDLFYWKLKTKNTVVK